jgi:superoxide dismutase, Fe-Mn family
MAFELPALPYAYDALEPTIDAQTMQIHHDKHHQAYVNNLNTAIAGNAALEAMSAEDLVKNLDKVPEDKRTAVRNNGGGHVNHTFFWEILTPGGASAPSGALAAAIDRDLGGLDALKAAVNKAGGGQFGSGWAWVVVKDGKLAVTSTPNQDSPLTSGATPILGVDVWEHAYYLKYQNKRPDYLAAIWNVINWDKVGQKYTAAGGK